MQDGIKNRDFRRLNHVVVVKQFYNAPILSFPVTFTYLIGEYCDFFGAP